LIVTLLMVVIVPKIIGMFEDMQAELPWNTKLLIFASDFIAGFWWLIILGMVGGVVGFRRWRASARRVPPATSARAAARTARAPPRGRATGKRRGGRRGRRR
jgi:type II secretory pathway component PulF